MFELLLELLDIFNDTVKSRLVVGHQVKAYIIEIIYKIELET